MGKQDMISREQALPGREEKMPVVNKHQVFGRSMVGPWPTHAKKAYFAMGCFWGAERLFWQQEGVYCTAVGYMGGYTPNPTYQEVCSGDTGHTETVMVVYNQEVTDYWTLLESFWENHDPTQGMRQGNDTGTQYRSAIFWEDDMQKVLAERSRNLYQDELKKAGIGEITTEINKAREFYFAEDEHQQYLHKVPNGYCGLKGTGVTCV
ncbi:peptide-methionine (S)-S-oxide reductase MsrA [Bermanella marisrubri]|uniref:Peptide methionine sulfoxide reductase MsrA n=1 Tax=Bermanella marisrubri TaxID=207949 RepID=Q1N2Q8_9GAMM|nr:peptide-methionine (S)-S-oxide reductase MsrA [Bermanella marisrubri]EAT12611.1 Peptide methionine sulfoxide reductase [Oceanobacter sp. RED65] [Bermanella marisrubri]